MRQLMDGDVLAISQSETGVAIVDVAECATRAVTTTDHHQAMTMSADGRLLLTGASSIVADSRVVGGGYAVHDTETGDIVYSSTGSEGAHEWVGASAFAPNGDLIAQVGRDSVALNLLNTLTASGSFERLMVVHDGADGTLLLELPVNFELIDIKVSSDGKFVAGLDYQGMLRLYDMEALRSGDGANAVFAIADVGLFTIDDGYVWMTVPERIARDRELHVGLVRFPFDRDQLESFVESKLSRDMTDSECQQFLGLNSCAERLAGLP